MSEEHMIEIGGKKYNLVKKGYDQATQVVQLGKWLGTYGMPALSGLDTDDTENRSYLDMLANLLDNLSPDALVSLFSLVTGCPESTAKKEFDIGILVDSITTLWDNQPGIRSLVQRFFSSTNSQSEESAKSSTQLEESMDGQTIK